MTTTRSSALDKTCCRKEGGAGTGKWELRIHELDGGSKSTLIRWVDLLTKACGGKHGCGVPSGSMSGNSTQPKPSMAGGEGSLKPSFGSEWSSAGSFQAGPDGRIKSYKCRGKPNGGSGTGCINQAAI